MNGFRSGPGGRSGAGLLGLALAVLLGSCDKKSSNMPLKPYTGPLMETTNVRTLFSDSAKLKWRLTAPLEQQFENGDVIYPQGMVLTQYSNDGLKTVVSTLAAKYGKADKTKNLYIMRGDVRVNNLAEQQHMNTEELFYDKTKRLIYTDSAMFVKVTTPSEYLTGYGLTANEDFSRYRIARPEGIFAAPQAGPGQ